MDIRGTPRYSDRLCSDRLYSNSPQSGCRRRVADYSWIGLWAVPIGKTSNQIPKIRGRGQYNCAGALEVLVRCNFSGGGEPQTSPEYPPHSPGPTPLGHLGAWINDVLSMHAMPRPSPILFQFLLFLHMLKRAIKTYWVVLTVDCRNSVCRNRVRRNSVCLPDMDIRTDDFYIMAIPRSAQHHAVTTKQPHRSHNARSVERVEQFSIAVLLKHYYFPKKTKLYLVAASHALTAVLWLY